MKKSEAIKTIEDFRNLQQNWNGYDASPISEKVIDKALTLIEDLLPVPQVFPTGGSSIQFEWESNELYLEMEIFEDRIEIFNHAENRGNVTTIGSN